MLPNQEKIDRDLDITATVGRGAAVVKVAYTSFLKSF